MVAASLDKVSRAGNGVNRICRVVYCLDCDLFVHTRGLDRYHDNRHFDCGADLDLANRPVCENPGHHLDGLDDRDPGDGSLDLVNQIDFCFCNCDWMNEVYLRSLVLCAQNLSLILTSYFKFQKL